MDCRAPAVLAMTYRFALSFLVIARERNRTGTPCEATPSPVPLRGETTLFPSVRFQDDGATKQSSQPARVFCARLRTYLFMSC